MSGYSFKSSGSKSSTTTSNGGSLVFIRLTLSACCWDSCPCKLSIGSWIGDGDFYSFKCFACIN